MPPHKHGIMEQPLSRIIQRLENEATLSLLKAGVPSVEVLTTKGMADLVAVAERHGLGHLMPQVPQEEEAHEEGLSSSPRSVRFILPPPPPEPPANLPAGMAALTRARAWRYQHIYLSPRSSDESAAAASADTSAVS